MTVIDIVKHLFGLLAGIGVFLIAIKIVGNNLEAIGGNKLKSLFAKTSKSNGLGIGIGALATAIIQSSGATSVMSIGFVNAGIMSLPQGCATVLGANIGTTITAQIVAIGLIGGGQNISASVILSGLAGIGAFMMYFAKKDMTKKIGGLLAGFGVLFVGLSMMSSPMAQFAKLDSVKDFIASINFPGYSILLVIVGMLLTAIIQSSSVTSSIAITMLVTDLISLNQGIYLILGSNIGACGVALLACLGSSRKARCVAVFHLMENVIRVIFFLIVTGIIAYISSDTITCGRFFGSIFTKARAFQLAMFHTSFNVVTVLLTWPIMDLIVRLSVKFVYHGKQDKPETEEMVGNEHLYYIDTNLLKTPPIAVQQTKNEVVNMAKIAIDNFNRALNTICNMDFTENEQFEADERELNFLNKQIIKFVVKLSKLDMSEADHVYLSTVFRTVSDLERIGDYAENIIEYARNLESSGHHFSDDAVMEIKLVQARITSLYDEVIKAYTTFDKEAYQKALKIEDDIDNITEKMSANHIRRLDAGVCTPDVGAQYLSLASNAERVGDHFMNVGKTVKDLI